MARCVAGILAAGLCAAQASGAELLMEQDFETVPPYLPGWGAGSKQVYKPATSWKTPFLIALDTADPHSGAKAVKIAYLETAPGDKIFHTQGVAVREAASGEPRRVRVRFYYRLSGLDAGAVRFSPMEIQGQAKERRTLAKLPLSPSEEWRAVEYEGTLSAGATQVQLMWINTSDTVPGALWLDDVSVELLTPGE